MLVTTGDKKKKKAKAQLPSPSAGLSGNVGVDVSAPELDVDAAGKGGSMELSLGAGAHKSKSGVSKTLSPPSPGNKRLRTASVVLSLRTPVCSIGCHVTRATWATGFPKMW